MEYFSSDNMEKQYHSSSFDVVSTINVTIIIYILINSFDNVKFNYHHE